MSHKNERHVDQRETSHGYDLIAFMRCLDKLDMTEGVNFNFSVIN